MHLSKEEEKMEPWTLTAFTFYFFKNDFDIYISKAQVVRLQYPLGSLLISDWLFLAGGLKICFSKTALKTLCMCLCVCLYVFWETKKIIICYFMLSFSFLLNVLSVIFTGRYHTR